MGVPSYPLYQPTSVYLVLGFLYGLCWFARVCLHCYLVIYCYKFQRAGGSACQLSTRMFSQPSFGGELKHSLFAEPRSHSDSGLCFSLVMYPFQLVSKGRDISSATSGSKSRHGICAPSAGAQGLRVRRAVRTQSWQVGLWSMEPAQNIVFQVPQTVHVDENVCVSFSV